MVYKKPDALLLAVVIAVFAILSIMYNLWTPYRQALTLKNQKGNIIYQTSDIGAPDEAAHVNYIRYIYQYKQLPIMSEKPGENYEFHQPPLYYILAAPIGWVGSRYSDAVEGFLLRLFSTLIGIATLIFIFKSARLLFPAGLVPFSVVSFSAFLPMQLAVFSSVNNDGLIELCYTIGLYIMLDLLRSNIHTLKHAFTLGLITALATAVKTSGWLLGPIALIVILIIYRHNLLKALPLFAFSFLIISVPILVRNTALYGDPLALALFSNAFKNTAHRTDIMSAFDLTLIEYYFRWVGWFTFRTFWGAFGYLIESFPLWLSAGWYVVLGLITIIIKIGFILFLMRRKDANIAVHCWVLGSVLAITWLAFIAFNWTYMQGQARYFTPAMLPISIFTVIGLLQWFPKKNHDAVSIIFSIFMLTLAIYAACFVLKPGFEQMLAW